MTGWTAAEGDRVVLGDGRVLPIIAGSVANVSVDTGPYPGANPPLLISRRAIRVLRMEPDAVVWEMTPMDYSRAPFHA